MQIGVISDTHGLLRPEALAALQGVDHILHAGDVGDVAILSQLRRIAPVTAIRGNMDNTGECAQLPATDVVELGDCLFYLVHSIDNLDLHPHAAGIGAVITGTPTGRPFSGATVSFTSTPEAPACDVSLSPSLSPEST